MPRAAKGVPKAGAAGKKTGPKGAHRLADPLPEGEILTDFTKKKWKLGKPVGSGGFGLLYLASPSDSKPGSDPEYVMKVEPHSNGPLFCELHFYQRVAKPEMISRWLSAHKLKQVGVPRYIASGSHENGASTKYRFMVMERFGTDLQKLFEANGKRFSRKTVLQLGIRLLNALEYIHDHEYVHADVKASNLLQGYCGGTTDQVYLVDYGLAYKYTDSSGQHKEYKEDPRKAHDGTIEFTSRDAHKGVAPSRRGDLEILGYCLLQWQCGTLPWEDKLQNKEYVRDQKFRYMSDIPALMRACFPSGDKPDEIAKFLEYVVGLTYTEHPNYNHLRDILRTGMKKLGYKEDGKLELGAPPSPAKGRAASPVKKKVAKKRVKQPSSDTDDEVDFPTPPAKVRAKVVTNGQAKPSPRGTPVKRATPKASKSATSPMAAASPQVKKVKASASAGRGRGRSHKVTTSVGTQTSPGLKGLKRSRKT